MWLMGLPLIIWQVGCKLAETFTFVKTCVPSNLSLRAFVKIYLPLFLFSLQVSSVAVNLQKASSSCKLTGLLCALHETTCCHVKQPKCLSSLENSSLDIRISCGLQHCRPAYLRLLRLPSITTQAPNQSQSFCVSGVFLGNPCRHGNCGLLPVWSGGHRAQDRAAL